MVLLDLIPVYIQFWGLISLVHDPEVEVSDVGHKPLVPQGKVPYFFRSLLIVDHCTWDGFWQEHVCASPTCLNVALLSFVVEALFI